MREGGHVTFVIDDTRRIQDDATTDAGFCVDDHARHDHRSCAELRGRRQPCRRMHEAAEGVAARLELQRHFFSPTVVAQPQRDEPWRLPHEPGAVADDWRAEHLGARFDAVVDEAVDRQARGANDLRDDLPVAAGTEDENGSGAHGRSIRVG